jgi:hypothetical protein
MAARFGEFSRSGSRARAEATFGHGEVVTPIDVFGISGKYRERTVADRFPLEPANRLVGFIEQGVYPSLNSVARHARECTSTECVMCG